MGSTSEVGGRALAPVPTPHPQKRGIQGDASPWREARRAEPFEVLLPSSTQRMQGRAGDAPSLHFHYRRLAGGGLKLERNGYPMNKQLRKAVIAGNWKMNNNRAQTRELLEALIPSVKDAACDVVVCVPFTDLETAVAMTKGTNIKVGAQNCHFEAKGAFTGEIAPGMLTEMGVEYVVLGHSERRQYFGETDVTVNKRVKAAIGAGLTAILCVGELLEQREQGITAELVAMQTKIALNGVEKADLDKIIIAYEPVWAIGTGKTATADQANEVCALIRGVIAELYGQDAADAMTIQYGGSMNAGNAAELVSKPDVDGGLIGGASLKAPDFTVIVNAASQG